MHLKTLTTLAAALIASTSWAAAPSDAKCGAGSCSKKEASANKKGAKEASCSKKDAGCAKKDTAAPAK